MSTPTVQPVIFFVHCSREGFVFQCYFFFAPLFSLVFKPLLLFKVTKRGLESFYKVCFVLVYFCFCFGQMHSLSPVSIPSAR